LRGRHSDWRRHGQWEAVALDRDPALIEIAFVARLRHIMTRMHVPQSG
jgi:hypothetical protein